LKEEQKELLKKIGIFLFQVFVATYIIGTILFWIRRKFDVYIDDLYFPLLLISSAFIVIIIRLVLLRRKEEKKINDSAHNSQNLRNQLERRDTLLTRKKEEIEKLRHQNFKIKRENTLSNNRELERKVEEFRQQATMSGFDVMEIELKLSSIKKEKATIKEELSVISTKYERLQDEKDKLDIRHNTLQENYKKEINKKLLHFLNTPVHIPRFIHEMYKRGFASQQERAENLRRAEILNELQEATNNQKQIQLLTQEEKIKLDVERNNFNIEKAYYQIEQRLNQFKQERWRFEQEQTQFSLDKRDFDFDKMVDKHDREVERYNFQQIQDAFQQEKQKATFDFEQREKDLQRKIEHYEIQQREDRLMTQERETLHKLQTERDKLNQERKETIFAFEKKEEKLSRDIRDATYNHNKRETLITYQERELNITRRENDLKAYNRQTQQLIREKEFELDLKQRFFELEKEKGSLEALQKIQTIQHERKQLEQQKTDLLFSEREIQNLAREKHQEIIQKEINAKQQIFYAFYDQIHLGNPVTLDKAFRRIGHMVDSPYLKRSQEAERQLTIERQNNLTKNN